MWIFLKGIPAEMDAKSLQKFIGHLLLPGWMSTTTTNRSRVAGTKILKIDHILSRSVEYHGLVKIEPATQTAKLIDHINQAKIKGRRLGAHPYHSRFARADRRCQPVAEECGPLPERRRLQRRRKHLVCQVVDACL